MSHEIDNTGVSRRELERNVLLVTYVLYGLGFFSGITAIAGVIINHVKMNDCRDRIAYSHHRWLMRTFWFTVLWSLVCLVLSTVMIGFLGYVILWIWGMYRFIRGVLAFAEHRAMPGMTP
ncbi:hypothetical protein T35B1_07301 [Salinisphaera shabanensis T35B1]|jgi:uncharacterized membrane protein|uniref:DUF4870 family protein n=1 Tax=Salinisphaera shabanensis TaxID=180542 RepID=UPI00333FCCDD|tara:strand:- start:25 stop:384 length:360 start_codon:yes stop_codon:yes gene_type:complete